MPQMANMSWVSLLMYFILVYLVTGVQLYFLMKADPKSISTKIIKDDILNGYSTIWY